MEIVTTTTTTLPDIHPTCIIAGEWDIHPSVVIYPYTQLSGKGVIGEGTVIGSNCTLLGEVHIGKNCRVQTGCFIPGGTEIGDDVFLGPMVNILNDKYPPSHGKYWMPVRIANKAKIGGGAILCPGATIGEGALVGAGAVVLHKVPATCVAIGNPARLLAADTEEEKEAKFAERNKTGSFKKNYGQNPL